MLGHCRNSPRRTAGKNALRQKPTSVRLSLAGEYTAGGVLGYGAQVSESVALNAARRALPQFVEGRTLELGPLGAGHIHDTYLATLDSAEPFGTSQVVLQRVNSGVFRDLPAVMDNIARVTAHARAALALRGVPDARRRVLQLRLTRAGASYAREPDGTAWRMFDYVPGSLSLAAAQRPQDAFEAGRAFGEFASLLQDLPAPPLTCTIVDFHATDARLRALQAAMRADPQRRAAQVQREWDAVERRSELALECSSLAARGQLPQRVAHNDAKLDNVLFDAETRAALCVIDLDTVMPGYLAHDFGDLVRTAACSGGEDNRELAQVGLHFEYVEALARGYLPQVASFVTPDERASLLRGSAWILLELGMRFLTDHLLGDRYFKIQRPGQNLDRARVQLHLLDAFERQREPLARLFDRL
jgi:aminoglycoside phosphotransferase (APT) family kinase protein